MAHSPALGAFVGTLALFLTTSAGAQAPAPGDLAGLRKISATTRSFGGALEEVDRLGISVARLGDLNGDGNVDVAVGALLDDDGGVDRGSVWILFLDASGEVSATTKINDVEGGFIGTLDDNDRFGISVAGLGDLDGNGVPDLAVGAYRDDDGCEDCGAVWLLSMNPDGSVLQQGKISATKGGFLSGLEVGGLFGRELVSLGDLDGDGIGELLVTANRENSGGLDRGAAYVLFLTAEGRVRTYVRIGDQSGGFNGALDDEDRFGTSAARLSDLDGDGIDEVAIGARHDDDGFTDAGAVYVLFLQADGRVRAHTKISATEGGFTGVLSRGDSFGFSLGAVGDLDGDGLTELAVGAIGDDDGGGGRGALWILFLNDDGTVANHRKFSSTFGDFTGALDDHDRFGASAAGFGDLDGDGTTELLVGASDDDDGVLDAGALWVLSLVTRRITPYGCGVNPRASLVVLDGDPTIGTTLTFGVDNPLGTQQSGASALVAASFARLRPIPAARRSRASA